ncbi:DUF4278 domain-containing protein [Crocosphaera sp. UHCC 0190]|uniref:DUF4278 domain-containing protein n=1 Tax=Crocosphaera sp. UHCC 0190 TaxID=3110246 RepID=UPI002B209F9B|nr:DUF4278 domain-containing protein [Crocosphaera sp. UHCC 0190]MEA5508569.1 DUF4278 domain-containing protein [Crocosphaera sp. UHCC 0190]
MKLSFRGIPYNHQPVMIEPSDGEVEGTYRGVHWKKHCYEKSRRHHVIKDMIYRGIHYMQG